MSVDIKPSSAKEPRPEREQTDASLRVERDNADRAMIERRASDQALADQVVERAREEADAVLATARDRADQPLGPDSAPPSLVERRVVADEVLSDERAAEDIQVRRERTEAARVLSRLLPLEREATDHHLLTERARSDDALTNRDDFLGIVSHDLRNLLGGIVMSADMLAQGSTDTEQGHRNLALTRMIQRHASRMNRLIADLVDVASIDAGKLAMRMDPGDAVAVVEEAVEMFRPAASAKGIAIQLEAPETPLPAAFDHDRLIQVLANLITNSIKFTERGGRMWVRVERAAEGVRFSVRDTGVGIPEDMLEAVFQRFWQVGENDRRGLGLGLFISRCIVTAHGGTITAESKSGAGSTFSFVLPVS